MPEQAPARGVSPASDSPASADSPGAGGRPGQDRDRRVSIRGLADLYRRGGDPLSLRERVVAQGAVYLLFVLTLIGFSIWAPDFATVTTLQDIGRNFAPVCVVSLGMTFVIIAAEIDLSVASTVSLAGLVGAVILGKSGVPWPVALLTSLAIGAAVGAVNGLLVGYLGVPSFLITLGTLEGVGAIALMATHTFSVPITQPGFIALFGPGSFLGIPLTLWWALAVIAGTAYLLHGTRFGQWVYAVGDSRNAARYAGINTARLLMIVFMLSGVLAAFTGVLMSGRTTAGDPTSGADIELTAIAAVILGGTDLFGGSGTILGTVVGALFLTAIQVGLILLGASGQLQTLVTGIIIVVIVTINSLAKGMSRA
jgi:ribose transport system permease protein